MTLDRLLARVITGFWMLAAAMPELGQSNRIPDVMVRPDAVSAVGKWALTTGKPGDEMPKHVVEIHCYRLQKLCVEAIAR